MADINNAIRDGNHITSALFKGSDGLTYNGRIDEITGRVLVDMAGAGAGTVTSIAAGTGILATPDPITVTGTIALATSLQPAASLAGNSLKVLRVNVGETAVEYATPTTGTVTSVSVTTANGVSGSVATATTTPAITITLGAITPSAVQISGLTASEIVGTDGSKNLVSLAVATYPSLTELTYVKGVTSAIQTQINTKQATITFGTNVLTALGVNIGSAGAVVLFNGALGTPSSGTVTNLTGTASININGTVGATTPTTGAFTTLSSVNNQNALTVVSVTNTTSGTAARTSLSLSTDTSNLVTIDGFSTGYTASGTDDAASSGRLLSVGAGGFSFRASHASGTIRFYTGATVRLTINADGTTTAGGNLVMGTNSITMTGSIAATGARVTKGWFTDIESTNMPTVGGTAILTSLTAPQFTTIELGNASDTTLSRSAAGVLAVEGVNVLTVAGGTLTGSITLGENTAIALDPAGSADGKYTGITITGVAGYAQTYGDLVYLAVADSRWEKTDADAAATGGGQMLGIVVVAGGSDGAACTLLLQGQIRADAAFPALTVGAPVYLGETAGAIQVAIPTGADNVIRVVGQALTADEIYFNPSPEWQISVA